MQGAIAPRHGEAGRSVSGEQGMERRALYKEVPVRLDRHPQDLVMTPLSEATVSSALLACCLLVANIQPAVAKDLLAPKEQETTEVGSTQSPSFDEQTNGIPQSLFTWIKMAKGYEVEWDTFGRKGWYTQDPRLKPVDSGSVFSPETPVIYIIFEVAPLEDPAQFAVQWFLEREGQDSPAPLGKDVLEVPGHERYGFLELKKPADKWAAGRYLAKLYIAPLGQQPFHAVNQVGNMRFTIVEHATSSATP
jgi:hypothetical protein